MSVVIDSNLFADLPAWEMKNVLGSATHTFFGLTMSQHPHAVIKLNQLLNATRPARIVEVGTGAGGLTVLFALFCKATGAALHSYDQQGGKHHELLAQLGYPVRRGDALGDPAVVEEIKSIVAREGRSVIFADAGKAIEANLLIPVMKPGDLILMHDFAPDAETFRRDIQGVRWNWFEAWYERVAEVSNAHGIVYSPYTNDVVWSVGIKTR
jgi:cephalosporin hydroxylase